MVDIRPARPADLARVREIGASIAARGVSYDAFSGLLLIAEVEGTVMGYVHALPGEPCAVITELAVDPAYGFKGLGAKLLESAEIVLRVMGCRAWMGFMREDHPALDGLRRRATDTGSGHAFVRAL